MFLCPCGVCFVEASVPQLLVFCWCCCLPLLLWLLLLLFFFFWDISMYATMNFKIMSSSPWFKQSPYHQVEWVKSKWPTLQSNQFILCANILSNTRSPNHTLWNPSGLLYFLFTNTATSACFEFTSPISQAYRLSNSEWSWCISLSINRQFEKYTKNIFLTLKCKDLAWRSTSILF